MSYTIAPFVHDTPAKMAAELRNGCLIGNFIGVMYVRNATGVSYDATR